MSRATRTNLINIQKWVCVCCECVYALGVWGQCRQSDRIDEATIQKKKKRKIHGVSNWVSHLFDSISFFSLDTSISVYIYQRQHAIDQKKPLYAHTHARIFVYYIHQTFIRRSMIWCSDSGQPYREHCAITNSRATVCVCVSLIF